MSTEPFNLGGAAASSPPGPRNIGLYIDGGADVISVGLKGYVYIPFACTITQWVILADQVGSIEIDVWKGNYVTDYPPTSFDTIVGTEKPTLTNQIQNMDSNLTTWTTGLGAGDVLAFNVDSVSLVSKVNISIVVIPT